jgi:hypothetical protein
MKPLRRPWLAAAVLLPALLLAALLGCAALVLQRTPLVTERTTVSAGDIARAMQLLRRHDPRRHPPGTPRSAMVPAQDLELLLNHGARRWWADTPVRLTVLTGSARVQASMPARHLPFDAWFNLELTLRESADGLPAVTGGHIGRLPVPGWLAQTVARRASRALGVDIDASWARDVVQRVQLRRDVVTVRYTWQADTRARMLASLLPPAEQLRLKAYSDRLAELADAAPADGRVSLPDLLRPLFALARQRSGSGIADADPAAENRAALAVLALHLTGRRLSSIVPAAEGWARPRWLHVTLHGRDDFPQHFVLSALIAAEGSSPLADAVGVYKETTDARSGSGFSFNDIAADRAGTRFGERAVQEPARLQAALAGPLREFDLMPDVSDLPEFLPEAEFRQRFGGVGAPAYLRVLADIDARLGSTSWWQ